MSLHIFRRIEIKWNEFLTRKSICYMCRSHTKLPEGWTNIWICILGLIGVAVSQVLFLVGLQLASPAVASAMQPAVPVFTFVLGVLTGVEVLYLRRIEGWIRLMGVASCCLGAFVIATWKGVRLFGTYEIDIDESLEGEITDTETASQPVWKNHNLGVVALLGNCFCFGVYFIMQVRMYSDPFEMTRCIHTFSCIMTMIRSYEYCFVFLKLL